MTRILLPKMVSQGGGFIVNLSSMASFSSFPRITVYSATKVCDCISHTQVGGLAMWEARARGSGHCLRSMGTGRAQYNIFVLA